MTRTAVAVAILFAALVVNPTIGHADAAGPTDFLTEIVAVEPPSDAIELSIVGGDAFVELAVEPGHEVVVLGYLPDQEPYLRFGADGGVERNVRSYATYYNEDRYGTGDIPDIVDTAADPEWERVADGGTYAWHDHRAHWMDTEPPIGLEPGDSLPVDEIPLVVDGVATTVSVEVTLQDSASPIPAVVGVLLGTLLGLTAFGLGRATATLVALLLAAAALVAGIAQYTSLPSSTDPAMSWWLLPAVAGACAVGVIAIYRRSIWIETGLLAVSGVQLALWAWPRREHATSAYVPTSLPIDLDRMISTMVLIGAVFVVGAAARTVIRMVAPDGRDQNGSATDLA